MILPFIFPAELILRLQVWRRRKNLAGKVLPPESDLFERRVLKKSRRSVKITRRKPDRRFEFQKRRQLFIPPHNETLSVAAMRVNNKDRSGFDASPRIY